MLRRFVAIASTVVGCSAATPAAPVASTEGPGDPADAAASDATVDPKPDAGARLCTPYGHEGSDGECETTLAFRPSVPFAHPRDHHVTFVAEGSTGARLYVLSGSPHGDNYGAERLAVYSAPLADDGAPGSFRDEAPLPHAAIGAMVAVVGRTVVITGGIDRPGDTVTTLDDTLVGHVADDGTVSAWEAGPKLPAARFHHGSVAIGDYVYVVGGFQRENAVSSADVAFAHVESTGKVSAWKATTPLPSARSHHSAFVHGRFLYVIGGATWQTKRSRLEIQRAEAKEDGSLGPWTNVGTLGSDLQTPSSVVAGDTVFVIGGSTLDASAMGGMRPLDSILAADLRSEDAVAMKVASEKLAAARHHVHQSPAYRGHTYVVSGRAPDETNVPTLEVADFR